MPERIAALLHAVGILLSYGRHLADTIRHRAAAPASPPSPLYFGTASLSVIFARLQRGLTLAAALERVLLACAASGRDIEFPAPRIRTTAALARRRAGARAGESPAAPRWPRCTDRDDSDAATPEQFDARVRRQPIGQTIVEICLDLAVVPGLCTGAFWNELFDLIRNHGGSVATLMRERSRREEAFEQEQDRNPIRGWAWWDATRETLRQALGFFIGEDPVDPFSPSPAPGVPAAALATGPP